MEPKTAKELELELEEIRRNDEENLRDLKDDTEWTDDGNAYAAE